MEYSTKLPPLYRKIPKGYKGIEVVVRYLFFLLQNPPVFDECLIISKIEIWRGFRLWFVSSFSKCCDFSATGRACGGSPGGRCVFYKSFVSMETWKPSRNEKECHLLNLLFTLVIHFGFRECTRRYNTKKLCCNFSKWWAKWVLRPNISWRWGIAFRTHLLQSGPLKVINEVITPKSRDTTQITHL